MSVISTGSFIYPTDAQLDCSVGEKTVKRKL